MAAALEAGVTRLFRIGGAHAIAALAYGTETVPRVDKIVGPGNRYVAAAKALVAGDCAIDFYAGPTEIVIVAGSGRPGVDRRRSHRAGRARSRRARDPHHLEPPLAERVARGGRRAQRRPRRSCAQSLARATARIIVDARRRRGDGAREPHRARAPRRRSRSAGATADRRAGAVFVGPFTAQAAGDYATGSNHVLPTAGAARFRGGLSAADFVRVDVGAARHARAASRGSRRRSCRWRAPKGSTAHARIDRGAAVPMSKSTTRSRAELYDGLRLHQNENTGGCSPRCSRRWRALRRRADRRSTRRTTAATRGCARYLGVAADRLALVNGLDEGIMALAVALSAAADGRPGRRKRSCRSRRSRSSRFDTAVAGGAARAGRCRSADFAFPLDERARGDHAAARASSS